MENKQTSAEWLFKQLWETPKDKFTWYAILEQAKAMEKEQIKKLLEIIIWYDEESDVRPDAEIYNWFKQYYNETFKKD